jgi:multidrug resistance efflux pump
LADLHHLLSGIVGQLPSLHATVRLGSTSGRTIPDIVGVSLRQQLRTASSRQVKLAALAVLVIYAVVMLWPYLAATLVRGSAVTAWTNVATAPIPGRTPAALPKIGSTVGPDGVILELVNEQLDPGMVPRAEAALVAARARALATKGYLDGAQEIDRDRRDLMKLYAGQFRSALDADIAERETRLGMLRTKVAAATQLADRTRSVADRGLRSGDYRDDAQMRLAEAEAELVLERMAVEQVKRRRAAADSGVFILADGSGPNWAYEHRQDAKTEVKRARLAAEEAASAEREAEQALAAVQANVALQGRATVKAPPGATIRSLAVGAGSSVVRGATVARWIDCNQLFIDAPVSDAALPLIPLGSEAHVIVEGEGRWRKAHVTNIRGAAETIGAGDLAAVAKGRNRGDGQVLLKLDAGRDDYAICPVGLAAYVHFPTAGVLAVMMARLGLR